MENETYFVLSIEGVVTGSIISGKQEKANILFIFIMNPPGFMHGTA